MKTLLITLMMFLTTSIQASEVATVVAHRGFVYADEVPIVQGSLVNEGATIVTDAKSFAVLQFYDGAKVTVRPSSSLILSSYKDSDVKMNLVKGGLRIITGSIAKHDPDNYILTTPTALMGVRGTEFSVQILEETVEE